MKDSTAEAAKSVAGQAMKQSIEAAGAALKSAGALQHGRSSQDKRGEGNGNPGKAGEDQARGRPPGQCEGRQGVGCTAQACGREALSSPAGPSVRRFLHGHATHPDWRIALALAAAQVERSGGERGRHRRRRSAGSTSATTTPAEAEALLAELRQRWPGVAWVGASGIGVAASGVEYFDEPALALLLAEMRAGAVPGLLRRAAARPLRGRDRATCTPTRPPPTSPS